MSNVKGSIRISLTISDSLLQSAHMTEAELRQEIAVLLFARDKLTLAQASRLAGLGRLRFQHLLASRDIPVHYDVAEFEEDLRTLRRVERSQARVVADVRQARKESAEGKCAPATPDELMREVGRDKKPH